jgi:hypothetical protein
MCVCVCYNTHTHTHSLTHTHKHTNTHTLDPGILPRWPRPRPEEGAVDNAGAPLILPMLHVFHIDGREHLLKVHATHTHHPHTHTHHTHTHTHTHTSSTSMAESTS